MNSLQKLVLGVGLLAAAAVACYQPHYQAIPGGKQATVSRRWAWDRPNWSDDLRLDLPRLAVEVGAVTMAAAGAALLAGRTAGGSPKQEPH